MLLHQCKSTVPIIPQNPSYKFTTHSCQMKYQTDKNNYRFHSHKIKAMFPLRNGAISKDESANNGIGITKYFRGRTIFITGATGMLGKVLVEKLLRSTDVGKIYMLVRAEDEVAALDRLTKQVINLELFKPLRQKHGKCYISFIREKLIPVVGNIIEPNMGIESELAREIRKEVDVIIESAAVATFDERYDVMLNANVNGPRHMMHFAKTCTKLKLLVHISTAFVCGLKEGTIMEEPVTMDERFSKNLPNFDVSEEMDLAFRSFTDASNCDITMHMKRIGMERASLYGYPTTYQLTKAMSEMFINEMRGDIPVLIIRPSVIMSCYNDPLPGWIEGKRMFDPLITLFGKGLLPAFLGNPDTILDAIPVDMVSNATIAAIAKHGNMHVPELNVYQTASGTVNPFTLSDSLEYLYKYFSMEGPLIEAEDKPKRVIFFDNFHDFSKYTREEMLRSRRFNDYTGLDDKRIEKLRRQCRAQASYVEQLCKLYEFGSFFKARFHSGNTELLLSEMSSVEKDKFDFDVRKIDWQKYFIQVHIPGLRKYVLKDKTASASVSAP